MYIGIDVGATKTLIAAGDSAGTFTEQKTFSTASDFHSFAKRLQYYIKKCMQEGEPESIVVAAPGTITDARLHAGGNVSWRNVDILSYIREVTGDIPMELLNDAAAAGLHEARGGSGHDHSVVLYVAIGTGIGSSVIINGQLTENFANSEGGRMLLDWRNHETFEQIASGKAFVDQHGRRGENETDPEVWKQYGRAVAAGVFSMATVVRPSIVVIGGSMGEFFIQYKDTVQGTMHQYADTLFTPPDVVAASQPTTAAAYGCIDRAMEIVHG